MKKLQFIFSYVLKNVYKTDISFICQEGSLSYNVTELTLGQFYSTEPLYLNIKL